VERLDAFYSDSLNCVMASIKSGEVRIVLSERRLIREEGYGVVFPFFLLHSGCRSVISVRPDLVEPVSEIVHDISDALALFKNTDALSIVEFWCKDVICTETAGGPKWSHNFVYYVDSEHFRPFTIPECRRLNPDDHDLIEEMNQISEFGCPEESIKDGTAFGVIVDGKLVARSSTTPTPNATAKYGLVWISVETLPEYRHRGYAKAVVSGTTETILSRGQIPVSVYATWNKASENTLKSLGYQLYGEVLRWQCL
jgi:hypothetical protein